MTREIIRPKSGTPPRAPLSPAVKSGNLVFVRDRVRRGSLIAEALKG